MRLTVTATAAFATFQSILVGVWIPGFSPPDGLFNYIQFGLNWKQCYSKASQGFNKPGLLVYQSFQTFL